MSAEIGKKRPLQSNLAHNTVLAGHLKYWRSISQKSQMELALQCGTSTRHLSFIETGRATPNRELLERICEELAIPIRVQSKILISAGYTPIYDRTGLSDVEMEEIKSFLNRMLKANEPFPAAVIDRCFGITMYNRSFFALCDEFVVDKTLLEPQNLNLLRVFLHPNGLARYLVNFPLVCKSIMDLAHDHLILEGLEFPLREILDEVKTYIPATNTTDDSHRISKLMLQVHLKNESHEVQIVMTSAILGSHLSYTLQELLIGVGYPINDQSEEYFKGIKRDIDIQ